MHQHYERATAGQQVDIRGAAVQVMKRMAVEDAICSKVTNEAGLAFVDGNGKKQAEFLADKEGGMSFTSDIEILRRELAKIFYDKSLEKGEGEVKYVFGDHVRSVHQEAGAGGKVMLGFEEGKEREFDLVIGADGMRSRVRR